MALDLRVIDFAGLVAALDAGYLEDGGVEWKAVIRATTGNPNKYQYDLRKAATSFANTSGGWIVFGVADARTGRTAVDRIEGLDPSVDAGKEIAQQFQHGIEAPIQWEIRNPPIVIPESERKVVPIYVPASQLRPHAVRSQDGHQWEFWKRESGTGVPMTYREIQAQFGQYEQQRLNARLLNLELTYIAIALASSAFEARNVQAPSGAIPTHMPSAEQIMRLFAEVFPTLSDNAEFIGGMMALRADCEYLRQLYERAVIVITGQTVIRAKYRVGEIYRKRVVEVAERQVPNITKLVQIVSSAFALEQSNVTIPNFVQNNPSDLADFGTPAPGQ